MSQAQDIAAIDNAIRRATAKNSTAQSLKTAWVVWFSNLGVIEKNFDSSILSLAKSKRDAFNRAQTGAAPSPSGVKPAPVIAPKARPTIRKTRPKYVKGSPEYAATVEWQKFLGFTGSNVDGDFYTKTHDATKNWQKAHGLNNDGVVGPLTWQKSYQTSGSTLSQPSTPAAAAQQAAAAVNTARVAATAPAATAQATQEAARAAATVAATTIKLTPKPAAKTPPKTPTQIAAQAQPATILGSVPVTVDSVKDTLISIHETTPLWLKVTTGALAGLSAFLGWKAMKPRRAA